MKMYTKEELNDILRLHKLWLNDAENGVQANLSGANLSGADLSGANLYGADLRDANLRGADLSRANLSRALLYGANLSRAFLYGANLRNANLRGADLGDELLEALLRAQYIPLTGKPTHEQLVEFWECEKTQGRFPVDVAKAALAASTEQEVEK